HARPASSLLPSTTLVRSAGDFRGAIEIHKPGFRQMLLPGTQVLCRHHLAAEKNLPHRIRLAVVQSVEGADEAQGRNRPDHGGDIDRKSTRLNSSHVSISY